jgi:hypothetical protein
MTHCVTSYLLRVSCGKKRPSFSGEVHHDRAGFEDADRRSATLWIVVDQHGHAMVRVDLQKFGFELVPTPDIAWDEVVIETQLLEQNGDFFAVWRRPKMQIEHGF